MVSEGKMSSAVLQARPAARAKLVAGRLCLDFANTVGGWQAGAREAVFEPRDDRMLEYADLLAWSWHAELLGDGAALRLWRESAERAREAAAVLERARRLRAAVHAIAWSFENQRSPRPLDLQALLEEVRAAREHQQLQPAAGRLEWSLDNEARALDAPLWPVALSAESYFTTGDMARLHSCPGEDCGWLFEDATRNRSRQWCDMGDCGNVAKLRRFRSRQARRKRAGAKATR
jgi:predicted RNA-binding Zn ribbon-like protein